jgi:hypothetical protein
MTEVAGSVKQVGQGLTQKTYKYDALGSLVNIITNAAGTSISPSLLKSIAHTSQAKLFKPLYKSRHPEVVEVEEAHLPAQFALQALPCQLRYPVGRVCPQAERRNINYFSISIM